MYTYALANICLQMFTFIVYLGQCKARPFNFDSVFLFFVYFWFFLSVLQQIILLWLLYDLQRFITMVHCPPWISLCANFMGTSYILIQGLSGSNQILCSYLMRQRQFTYDTKNLAWSSNQIRNTELLNCSNCIFWLTYIMFSDSGSTGPQILHRKHVTEIHLGQSLECWSNLSRLRFD